MLFSIATPVLNGWPQVTQCVGSIRGQTGTLYEHLVRDGGSTDGTREWLTTQSGLNAVYESDLGMYDAINHAWCHSRGDVLAWLNADEQYLPGTFKRVQAYFESHPDADAVFGNAIIIDRSGRPVSARREIPLRAVYVRNSFLYALSSTLFFRRRLLEQGMLVFDPAYRIAGDMDLILQVLKRGVKIHHINQYLALYIASGLNLSATPQTAVEVHSVQCKHHALPTALLRRLIMSGRYCERLLKGCYRHENVTYDYALDETPHYRTMQAMHLTPFFSFHKLTSMETTS